MQLSLSLRMEPSAIRLFPAQRHSRPLFYIPNPTPSHPYSSSLPPSIVWYITVSSLSPNKSGWPQMISVVGIQCKCSWAVWLWRACMGFCAVPCCFVIALHCLEEPCSRWMRGPPVLEKGSIHCQHLLTDQMKHRLNLQIKSCRTNSFQTCFYSKVNWYNGTVHFDYRILLRV